MSKIITNEKVEHPEGKILLCDGSVLECWPKDEAGVQADNQLGLDQSGEYLRIKGAPKCENAKRPTPAEVAKPFTDNAIFFLQHAKEILSDSRLFLAPVPVQNGLAYTGTSGFNAPTLGVYVEWWLNFEKAVMEEGCERWATWYIAGSPLSGSNKCSIVNAQGQTKTHSFSPFSPVWSSFMRINSRYDQAKAQYQAYNLAQAVEILREIGPACE